MHFETGPRAPTVHDFMRELQIMVQKWTAEGNIDTEIDTVMALQAQVVAGDISPTAGIERLQAIDAGRIER